MKLKANDKAVSCSIVNGDMIAIVGENRKLLTFPMDVPILDKVKELSCKDKDGGCSDATIYKLDEGMIWFQKQVEKELKKKF